MDTKPTLKLNTKNTLYIGCAFFSILMVWQVYNHYCPLFLDYLLRLKTGDSNEFVIGCIMAVDNLLALFMLPLFGRLSDRCNAKMGKRMPFIIFGMLATAFCFPLIALMFYLETLTGVILMMLITLIAMNIYRNPAVALMPDLTPKPLRSQANGIINFIGYLGAILAGGLAMFLTIAPTNDADWTPDLNGKFNALIAFLIASAFLIIALLILISKINEKRMAKEMKEDMEIGEKFAQATARVEKNEPLTKADRRNLYILLAAVLLWFMAFNAIETFNSLFSKNILGEKGESAAGIIVIILTVSSIITFLLAINLPAKIGRFKCVIIGLCLLIAGFLANVIFLISNGIFKDNWVGLETIWPIYIFIAICGVGWALVNANSYPMMVELSSSKDIGKYTGLYYTFSMAAQTITPMLVGLIMYSSDYSLRLLYIYSTVIMIGALIVFSFFKENKQTEHKIKKGFSALDDN